MSATGRKRTSRNTEMQVYARSVTALAQGLELRTSERGYELG